ncbi:MAG: hypothetical protein K2X86_14170 [Cytophagaceae bacterium]|nr:hypothetical protein [Cytophagaceae bacterium]
MSLKLIAGILVGLLYFFYYSEGDTLLYEKDASALSRIFFIDKPEYFNILVNNSFSESSKLLINSYNQPRVIIFIKVISILKIFTLDNYWIDALYLSLFSFLGIWYLSNYLIKKFEISKSAVLFSFFLFPSFVFWTSGVLKEAFVTGSVYLTIYFFLKYIYSKEKINLPFTLLIPILLLFTWKIKYYYLLLLIPVLSTFYLLFLWKKRIYFLDKTTIYIIFFMVTLSALCLTGIAIHPSISLEDLTRDIYQNHIIITKENMRQGIEAYSFESLTTELSSYIKYILPALIVGFFRPFILETHLDLSFLVGLENTLVFILFFTQAISLIKTREKFSNLAIATIIFVIIAAIFTAFIGPNWGTLTRYKTLYISFFILLLTNNNLYFNYLINLYKRITNNSKSIN